MKSEAMIIKRTSNAFFWKCLTMLIVIGLGVFVYSQWNGVMITIVSWQKMLHSMLAAHIHSVSENAMKYGGGLILVSFVYGVFHAVGPGHGKAVIVTYLGTNKESVKKGIGISMAAAVLQSIIAILLVSGLAQVLKFKLTEVQGYGNDIALVSYMLIMLLGVMLIASSLRRLRSYRRGISQKIKQEDHSHDEHSHGHKHSHDEHSHSHDHSHNHDHSHDHHEHTHHHHDASCGCSHAHVAEENQSFWQTLIVIFSMGFRPCSGAIVVLIYAHLVGVYSYGVVATFIMGLGTGLSVSLIAVATLYMRTWLEKFVAESSDMSTYSFQLASHIVRLIGGLILLALGSGFYSAAVAISSGHPLF